MESKIFIDVNYASRFPQIAIQVKESDDPRDKLIAMLLGEAMPGIGDGFCRIERWAGSPGESEKAIITPIHPTDVLRYIPQMRDLATLSAAFDTSGAKERYEQIIESEWKRIQESKLPTKA